VTVLNGSGISPGTPSDVPSSSWTSTTPAAPPLPLCPVRNGRQAWRLPLQKMAGLVVLQRAGATAVRRLENGCNAYGSLPALSRETRCFLVALLPEPLTQTPNGGLASPLALPPPRRPRLASGSTSTSSRIAASSRSNRSAGLATTVSITTSSAAFSLSIGTCPCQRFDARLFPL
jgi:hypothetical protein